MGDNMIKELENGVRQVLGSEDWKHFLDVMSRFHDYSANNCLLIMLQKPEATAVAGYKTWQKLGRQVRKGETSIKILAPTKHKKKVEKDGEEKEVVWTTFHPVGVFDISQTDGEDLPTICEELTDMVADAGVILAKLGDVAGIPVEYEDIQSGAKGYYAKAGKIVIKSGMSDAQTIKTLAHEVAHSILHKAGGEQEKADRNTKEVQAESVAFLVCNGLGIRSDSYTFEYIASWSDGKEPKELLASMAVIQKTANTILAQMAA